MSRRIIQFASNVDALVPLILGIAVSALGLFDIATPHVVDSSILIVLAVLSFALLRDRWIRDSSAQEARNASAEMLLRLTEVEHGISPLSTLNQMAERMYVSVEGLAAVKTLKGADIDRAHEDARVHTDRWTFKGGTGTYTRAMTLPICIDRARRERRTLQVRLEILDPTNEPLCERYARYRTSLSAGPDGTGERWTTDRTRKESFATLLAAFWYQQKFQLLDISVGLALTMSTFRFDLSASRIIITQDDSRFPAMVILSSSPLYESYATELRLSLSQARHVALEEARVVFGEQLTEPQVREFFASIRLPLPDSYDDDDVRQIIDKAIRAKNPYGRESYETADSPSALSPFGGRPPVSYALPEEGTLILVDLDLFHARAIALEAAEAAGDLVRDRLFGPLTIRDKGSLGDVVTDLDVAAEKLIVGTIQTRFPRHRVISEEMGDSRADLRCGDNPWTWLVDPVDGTNNLVIGLAVLTVGITLCRYEVPVVSVVHDPVSRRTWSAIRRQGAWDHGGLLARPKEPDAKRRPLLAWIQGYSVGSDDWMARALKIVAAHAAHRVLELWAPLTCWMMLVRGDIDGIIGYRIGEIDLYAGALVASEVGLVIQEFSGVPFVSRLRGLGDDQCIIAGAPRIVTELAGLVSVARRVDKDLARLVVPELQ